MRGPWEQALQQAIQHPSRSVWLSIASSPHRLAAAYRLLSATAQQVLQALQQHPVQQEDRLISLCCPLDSSEEIDLFAWLCAHPHEMRLFWADRNRDMTYAGLGCALAFSDETPEQPLSQVSSYLQDAPQSLRFFGGQAFDPKHAPTDAWRPMHKAQWRLPALTISQETETCSLTFSFVFSPKTALSPQTQHVPQAHLLQELPPLIPPSFQKIPITRRHDTPSLPHWCEAIEIAKQTFSQQDLEKVVLARETCLQSPSPLPDPFALLRTLYDQAADTYIFGFQGDAHTTFVGASPERLYARDGKVLYSEALAGTRPRKADPAADHQQSEALLSSEKDRYEQLLVIRELEERFDGLCEEIQYPQAPRLRKLKHVQHLWTPIQGKLRQDPQDAAILATLHPTPAVGGRPRPRALALLHELERFSRGWYAAPIGWVGPQGAEFCVGIRSALFSHDRLFLFTGAGIVPDSEPETEWRELEQKLKTFWEFVDCTPDFKPPT